MNLHKNQSAVFELNPDKQLDIQTRTFFNIIFVYPLQDVYDEFL